MDCSLEELLQTETRQENYFTQARSAGLISWLKNTVG
jgi:hypothetical protein